MRKSVVLALLLAHVLAAPSGPLSTPTATVIASPSPTPRTPTPSPPATVPAKVTFSTIAPAGGLEPAGRYGAAAGYYEPAGFFLLGGRNLTQTMPDGWLFSPGALRWSRIKPSYDAADGAYAQAKGSAALWLYGGVDSAGVEQRNIRALDMANSQIITFPNSTAPDAVATTGVAAAVDSGDTFLHFFGGSYPNGSCTNTIATWATPQRRWIVWNNTKGRRAPAAVSGAAMVDYLGTIYMFGGVHCSPRGTDAEPLMWLFNYRTGTWSSDDPIKPLPPTRAQHLMVVDPGARPNPQLVVFGGITRGTRYLNDIWTYDLVTKRWSNPSPDPPQSVPQFRSQVAGQFVIGRLLFYGGRYGDDDFNDLWQFVDQTDCLESVRCSDCTGLEGCGWCWNNPLGQRCISGDHDTPYLPGTCNGFAVSPTAYTNDQVLCPSDAFPTWAIALIVIGGIVIIGIIIFVILKMRSNTEYEEIQG